MFHLFTPFNTVVIMLIAVSSAVDGSLLCLIKSISAFSRSVISASPLLSFFVFYLFVLAFYIICIYLSIVNVK